MGLFDLFRKPESEREKLLEEWNAQLFPGGRQEILFKAKTVVELSNGKLDISQAAKVYAKAKTRYKAAALSFDGTKKSCLHADELLAATKADAQGKLSAAEPAAIIFYVLFDKIDPSLETPITIKKYLDGAFGSDSVGCGSDEIPSGI